jgi:hypothetical protein
VDTAQRWDRGWKQAEGIAAEREGEDRVTLWIS